MNVEAITKSNQMRYYSTMKFTNDYRLSSRPPPSVDRHFSNWSNGTTIGFTSSNLTLWAVLFSIPQTYILRLGYQAFTWLLTVTAVVRSRLTDTLGHGYQIHASAVM